MTSVFPNVELETPLRFYGQSSHFRKKALLRPALCLCSASLFFLISCRTDTARKHAPLPMCQLVEVAYSNGWRVIQRIAVNDDHTYQINIAEELAPKGLRVYQGRLTKTLFAELKNSSQLDKGWIISNSTPTYIYGANDTKLLKPAPIQEVRRFIWKQHSL